MLILFNVKFPSLFACSLANSGYKGMCSLADILEHSHPSSCIFAVHATFLGSSLAILSSQSLRDFYCHFLQLQQTNTKPCPEGSGYRCISVPYSSYFSGERISDSSHSDLHSTSYLLWFRVNCRCFQGGGSKQCFKGTASIWFGSVKCSKISRRKSRYAASSKSSYGL